MQCCSLAYGLRANSNGRGRSPTRARCRRKRGLRDGPEPGGQRHPGSKHHLLVDGRGIPLAFSVTGGNRNDVTQLIPLLDGVPAVRGAIGRPRRRPERVGRPRLRPRQVPAAAPAARRQADDCSPPDGPWLRPRPRPLGRRAHLRVAAQLQAPGHPLRTPRRHAPRIARARLLPRLLSPAREVNPK